MYALALRLRGVLAGKPVCERHRRSLTTSLPERFGVSGPEACGDVAFFLAHRVGIDGRGRELGMAQPALHEIEGDPFFDTGHAKPMPQAFGARRGPAIPARAMISMTRV